MLSETAERLNNQAINLAATGDYDDAIVCFMRAITIENENALLWFNLGLTYRDAGNLKQAKAALVKAHALNDMDVETIETLALVCFTTGNPREAIDYCEEGLDMDPMNPYLWNTLGVIFFDGNNYEDACEAFERAVALNPYYYDALFNLRDTYDELGNTAGMEECAKHMGEIEKHGLC